jgi:hypothetical protein
MRFFGLIALIVAVAGIATASALPKNGSKANVELTFTKWIAPYPNFVGSVGGDYTGAFGGAALSVVDNGTITRISAIYIVIADDPAKSLTMRIDGVVNDATGTAVFKGRVIDGRLSGSPVNVRWSAIACSQAPDGTCYQGTISVKPRSDD